jgi:glyoxylase-like metal-dependent hydrolase (beta-lactamase superfamily II)
MGNPTSEAQFAASGDGSVPGLELVRPRVWSLGVPMPGGQRGLAYTLAVLLLDSEGGIHVIDPGWDSDANRDRLLAAVAEIAPGAAVVSLIITHLHPDHLGMAERLRRETGAGIVMHELESSAMAHLPGSEAVIGADWGVPEDRLRELIQVRDARVVPSAVVPDVVVRGAGGALAVPGFTVEAMHTPGHTQGSMCVRLPELGLIATGDHVLPAIYPGLGLGGPSATNPIADYLASLEVVARFDDHEVLPGHGYRFRGIAARCTVLAAHHGRRTAQVAAALTANPAATPWQVASTLTWSAGWANLQGFYLYSALAQTAMHMDLVGSSAAA